MHPRRTRNLLHARNRTQLAAARSLAASYWPTASHGPAACAPARGMGFLPRALVLVVLFLLAACFGTNRDQRPAEVRWDRDVGEFCGMIISDTRFAAQVVEPDGTAHKFDDIGCLVHWLHDQPWAAQARVWVRDSRAEGWIDVKDAYFRADAHSPMDYGFAASASAEFGNLRFDQMRSAAMAMGVRGRRPAVPSGADGMRPMQEHVHQ